MIINKAVRNHIASQQDAIKMKSRKNIGSLKFSSEKDVDHTVGQLLQSYPHEKLDLLKMGAVDLG